MQPTCCAELFSDPGRYSTAVSKTDPTSDVFVTHRRIIPAGSLVGGGTTCFVLLWGFSQEIETPDYYSHTHTHIYYITYYIIISCIKRLMPYLYMSRGLRNRLTGLRAGKSEACRAGGSPDAQAGADATVLRQNHFSRKPQFLLVRPFS